MSRIDGLADRPSGRSAEPDDSSSVRPSRGVGAIRRVSPVEERLQPRDLPQDEVTLSPRGIAAAEAETEEPSTRVDGEESESARAARRAALTGSSEESDEAAAKAAEPRGSNGEEPRELSPEEAEILREMKSRDREVRAHEQAHLSAAGALANGGMNLEYERGPDGKRYAISGRVSLSLRRGRTPEETMRLARQAQQAALAPADPSPQDRRVAAKAAEMQREARQELQRTNEEEARLRLGQLQGAAEPTRPTQVSQLSESAPSDPRPDPVQTQAAEAQARQLSPSRGPESEIVHLDEDRDLTTVSLSRRAVRAYGAQPEVGDSSSRPKRRLYG